MNISQKFLQNNGLSQEKKNFYENLPSRYSKISTEYLKKSSNEHSNFNKKVLNWLFNQNEETRMLLCSVENKKYTNTIHEAYTYLIHHENGVLFHFSEEDNIDENKFKFDVETKSYNKYFGKVSSNNYTYNYLNKNPYMIKDNLKEIKSKDSEFLNNIMFYQSESPIEDIDNYGNYFTLKKDILKNEQIFKHFCNVLSYDNFLATPIMIKKDVRSKIVLSFALPFWITNDIIIKQKHNLNYEDEVKFEYNMESNNTNNNYFSLAQYCLSLIEQVLCVRYLIYNQSKDLNEIISSIYLKDLLSKKELMLDFLNTSYYDPEKFYEKFEIGEINTKLFYDQKIEEFIKEKNINIINILEKLVVIITPIII